MTETITIVEIDFFKPTGFSDTWAVKTEDRGLAVKTVMSKYNSDLRYLNGISCRLSSDDYLKYHRIPLIEPA